VNNGHGPDPVHSITAAVSPHSDDLDARIRRYLISMAIRVLCVLAAIVVHARWHHWSWWIPAIGAVILPYIAVVMANAVGQRRPGAGPAPVPPSARYTLPSGARPGSPSAPGSTTAGSATTEPVAPSFATASPENSKNSRADTGSPGEPVRDVGSATGAAASDDVGSDGVRITIHPPERGFGAVASGSAEPETDSSDGTERSAGRFGTESTASSEQSKQESHEWTR